MALIIGKRVVWVKCGFYSDTREGSVKKVTNHYYHFVFNEKGLLTSIDRNRKEGKKNRGKSQIAEAPSKSTRCGRWRAPELATEQSADRLARQCAFYHPYCSFQNKDFETDIKV